MTTSMGASYIHNHNCLKIFDSTMLKPWTKSLSARPLFPPLTHKFGSWVERQYTPAQSRKIFASKITVAI